MCTDGASKTDLDIWADRVGHGGGMEFVLWAYQMYRIYEDTWDRAGYFDALNQALPFAKMMNAIWLLEYGLSDNHALQWHGTVDYKGFARARSSRAHNQIHYDFGGDLDGGVDEGVIATAHTHQATEDSTEVGCKLFNLNDYFNEPVARASTFVHEGWHHWQAKYEFDTSHMDGPVGACTAGDGACDWYYWHGVGEFEFGDMWTWKIDPDGTSHRFHSPYQAEAEFLCDLAEYPASWVPAGVTMLARSQANVLLPYQFRNAVAYRCGDPRPW